MHPGELDANRDAGAALIALHCGCQCVCTNQNKLTFKKNTAQLRSEEQNIAVRAPRSLANAPACLLVCRARYPERESLPRTSAIRVLPGKSVQGGESETHRGDRLVVHRVIFAGSGVNPRHWNRTSAQATYTVLNTGSKHEVQNGTHWVCVPA